MSQGRRMKAGNTELQGYFKFVKMFGFMNKTTFKQTIFYFKYITDIVTLGVL